MRCHLRELGHVVFDWWIQTFEMRKVHNLKMQIETIRALDIFDRKWNIFGD